MEILLILTYLVGGEPQMTYSPMPSMAKCAKAMARLAERTCDMSDLNKRCESRYGSSPPCSGVAGPSGKENTSTYVRIDGKVIEYKCKTRAHSFYPAMYPFKAICIDLSK